MFYSKELIRRLMQPVTSYNEALSVSILNASMDAIIAIDERSRVLEWNKAAEDLFQYTRKEAVGATLSELILPARFVSQHRVGMKKFLGTGVHNILKQTVKVPAVSKDLNEFTVELTVVPTYTNSGFIFTATIRRFVEVEEIITKNDLMAKELNHRVKNVFAVVQSIARQTLGNTELSKLLSERLIAMSKAHEILFQQNYISADLLKLTKSVLTAFDSERIKVQGYSIDLDAKIYMSFSLAIYELTTNAIKYGALSNDTGYVLITWSVLGDKFVWVWEEFDGPLVSEPKNLGFGMKLLERSFVNFGIVTKFWNPSGFKCLVRLDMPVS